MLLAVLIIINLVLFGYCVYYDINPLKELIKIFKEGKEYGNKMKEQRGD